MRDFPFSRGQIVLSGGREVRRGHAPPVSESPEVSQELGPDVDLRGVVWGPHVATSSVVVGAGAALGRVLAVGGRGGGVCGAGARGVGEAEQFRD